MSWSVHFTCFCDVKDHRLKSRILYRLYVQKFMLEVPVCILKHLIK